ncbi:MAG: DUF4292 domain-containing protein [Bacteroidetes bacterium]|nr:DUF4292 domain-containing protein [Bacteroidota bacterium]
MKIHHTLILFLLPLLFACKAKKNLPPHEATKCKLDYKSAKTLTSLLKQNQVEYSTFSGKIKASVIIDDKGTDFTIALRMKKDSVIWASISPALGIEVIRFSATKDSIKFIDRIHNKYFVGDYDTLTKMLKTEIDLEILQSLLVGNSVEFYMEDEKLRAGIDSCKYLLGTIRKRKLRKVIEKGKELKEPAQNIWLLDSTFKIVRILFREFESRREFDAYFDNFQNVDLPDGQTKNIFTPRNLTYYIKSDKIITVALEYTKASANKEQTFPFTIPEGYDRIK